MKENELESLRLMPAVHFSISEVRCKSQVKKALVQNTDQSANYHTPPQCVYKIWQDHETLIMI